MDQDPVVIVGAKRTPMGGFQGDLSSVSAPELGTHAIKAALEDAGLGADQVDEVIMGLVLPAGTGQAPARQASRHAGIPDEAGATTINKVCGSGMKAAMLAHDGLLLGNATVVVAGGMESMTNAPYLLPNARGGMRLGHGQVKDHMFLDGLEDAYEEGRAMGTFAEDTAEKYQFTREAQDAYAIESLKRAKAANEGDAFKGEIAPITLKTRKGEVTVSADEQPFKASPEKIPNLKPAFRKDGTVTAANSSSISDGAAAMVLMRKSEAEKRGLTPIAAIRAHATNSHAPEWFTTAPVKAIEKVVTKAGWTTDEVDLYEINEAFAVVPMAAMHDLGLSHDKVNINGGACALGHPLGASGARVMVTLINALRSQGRTKGVASLCIGGGEATAIALEMLN
ncbi:acetyl-CoA C-acyltransferase [Pyruvatibacter mobilis]|uniref:Beta-ketothiolase n=1 Tax=Pyruvatibacter mobilis TaxID=1712261 RepID=A0A845Q7H1_9HYPH|nr:acetyl-CoA C-acyltransferase [Pyruvatibacter mobilis]NBG94354.1 acetyl-CoA C-acyltransferase [Pyruvatibacter mobilis]QJD76647.1 acetyl-CoA C-acyltransferase [Pyruvatibacter mobilis]GGD02195.1 acetyl-CoA acetyltransferase [Pyruvatibacter mobilis]